MSLVVTITSKQPDFFKPPCGEPVFFDLRRLLPPSRGRLCRIQASARPATCRGRRGSHFATRPSGRSRRSPDRTPKSSRHPAGCPRDLWFEAGPAAGGEIAGASRARGARDLGSRALGASRRVDLPPCPRRPPGLPLSRASEREGIDQRKSALPPQTSGSLPFSTGSKILCWNRQVALPGSRNRVLRRGVSRA